MWFPKTKYVTPKRMAQLERNIAGPRYANWKKAVLKRDDNCCQWSGCNEKETLQVHHIKRWADAPHLRYNVYNGITLCAKHHQSIYGREKMYEVIFLKKNLAKDNNENSN